MGDLQPQFDDGSTVTGGIESLLFVRAEWSCYKRRALQSFSAIWSICPLSIFPKCCPDIAIVNIAAWRRAEKLAGPRKEKGDAFARRHAKVPELGGNLLCYPNG
jgi:hypothetical protein